MTGMIKTKNFSESSFANLWLRIDSIDFSSSGFANGWPNFIMEDTDWIEYELRLYVPADAAHIYFGAILGGKGEMWVDDFHLEAFDDPDFR